MFVRELVKINTEQMRREMKKILHIGCLRACLSGVTLMFYFLQPVNAVEGQEEFKQSGYADLTTLLRSYAMSYPDIHFVLLSGQAAGEYVNDFNQLLGDEASNLDYEHPEQVRDLLMQVQIDRIRLMLDEDMPSSTLFKAGKNSALTRPFICVLTLNENVFVGDPLATTRFITGTDKDSDIHYLKVLDNKSFLHFTFHHEVFHCLDAYHNGPTRPMTKSKITSSYSDFRAEQRADLYASVMHRFDSLSETSFLKDLAGFRALSIFNWDISHYTTAAINHAMTISNADFVDLKTVELVEFAMNQADQVVITRASYNEFLAAAAHMAMSLGIVKAHLAPEVIEIMDNEIKADDQWHRLILKDMNSTENYVSYD
jgi:hypothetical protein